MFDYSVLHWTTFFGAAVLLNISPGPDMAFIMGQAARRGRHAGKVAVFFLAFLPQFVVPSAGPVSAQLFVHGALIIVVASLIELWLVLGAARAARALQNNHRIGLWLDRSLGALLVMFGLRLVFSAKD